MNLKRASLWVGLFAVLGYGVSQVERHSNEANEAKVRAEAAARCPAVFGERGGVWK